MSAESRRWRCGGPARLLSRASIGSVLYLASLWPPAGAMAAPACPLPSGCSTDVTVLGLSAVHGSLELELSSEPGYDSLILEITGRDGTVFESAIVNPDEHGQIEVSWSHVLPGTETRDIFYRIEAKDVAFQPLMEPYPFAVVFECGDLDCDYEIIPGIETEALLVTSELDEALAHQPPCQLAQRLESLERDRPDLRGPVQTLRHQLNRRTSAQRPALKQAGCVHGWKAVIRQHIVDTSEHWSIGGWSVAQVVGDQEGGSLQHAFQGNRQPDPGSPWVFAATGATELEMSIICLDGDESCHDVCSGNVVLTHETCQCATVEAFSCRPSARAKATVMQDLLLTVNHTSRARTPLSALAKAEPQGVDGRVLQRRSAGEAPLSVAAPLEAKLSTQVGFGFEISGAALDPFSSGAYAFGAARNTFRLNARGISSCTESSAVQTHLVGHLHGKRDGGILLRRWHPPDDLRLATSAGGGSDPVLPILCSGGDAG